MSINLIGDECERLIAECMAEMEYQRLGRLRRALAPTDSFDDNDVIRAAGLGVRLC